MPPAAPPSAMSARAFAPAQAAGISYLRRPGRGVPLVLLHGIGSHAASFSLLLEALDPQLDVIAWNAPGYGGSAGLAQDWPVEQDYARALARFLDSLMLPEVALFGHSLGALMAGAFATLFPARVRALVLAAPALGHGQAQGHLGAAAQARLDDLARLGAKEFASARAARLVFAPADNPALVARVESAMASVDPQGYGQAARMLASGRLLDLAAQITAPTTVIAGAGDVITPPEGAERLYAALRPASRMAYHLIPAAGHALYQQAPAATAQAISAGIAPLQEP